MFLLERANNGMMMQMETFPIVDAYDGPWKAGMDGFLPDMMALLFPAAWAEIDWSRPYVALNVELPGLSGEDPAGRTADALYKVFRLDGSEQWLVFHIEVQSTPDHDLVERMFEYLIRAWQKFGRQVFGFVVLGDLQASFRPGPLCWQLGEGMLLYKFETVKLIDFRDRIAELEASPNPFALVVLAHLFTKETKNDQERRRAFKLRLTLLLARRNYDREQIGRIFEVLDWMMRLEPKQAIIYQQEVTALREDNTMSAYVNTFQMVARWEGQQEGLLQGRQEGLVQGTHLCAERILRNLLIRRFGELPSWATARLKEASTDALERWSLQLLDATRLEDVFA